MKLAHLIKFNPYKECHTEDDWISYQKASEDARKGIRFYATIENKTAHLQAYIEGDGEWIRLWHRVWEIHWTIHPSYVDLPQVICEVLRTSTIGENEHISQDTLDWEQAILINEKIMELALEIPSSLSQGYDRPSGLRAYDTLEKYLLLGKPFEDYQQMGITDYHIKVLMGLRSWSIEGFWNSVDEKYRYRDLAAQISSYEGDLLPEDREGYGVEFE